MKQIIVLELNEINFDFVRHYVGTGKLPALGRLIDEFGLRQTTSETQYEHIEPWIQWVTAHTGLTLAEHGVFRLGDIEGRDLEQIWETLESAGVRVGAVSPMNAENRTRSAAFFVPDPWTHTRVTGSFLLTKLYGAIAQAVNENAQSRITPGSIFWLLAGAAVYARPTNYRRYLSLAFAARKKSWPKAIFLDLLLSDVFIRLMKKQQPGFATLFLNAGAHIQHHYLFNSGAYDGQQANPAWYASDGEDPVLSVYEAYDRIVAAVRDAQPDARLLIATGLHQDPHPKLTYYWRLSNHARFLDAIGLRYDEVLPRMSRDFLVRCADPAAASEAERILRDARGPDGLELFSVDNRGTDLFVMLEYPNDIGDDFKVLADGRTVDDFRQHVAFVAIKNGQHNGVGYLLDTGDPAPGDSPSIPLASLPDIIRHAFGVSADQAEPAVTRDVVNA